MGKHATAVETRKRVEFAMDLIARNPGVRPYKLSAAIMQETGLSRRSANRILQMAHEEMSRTRGESLASLQDAFADLFAQAWSDPKNRAALLRTLAMMPTPQADSQGEQTPDAVQFEILPQQEGDGEALPDHRD